MPRQRPRTPSGDRSSSAKQQRRAEAQRKTRQTRLIAAIAGIALLAVIAVIVLITANRPPAEVGEFTTVPTQTWPDADGTALGPPDAKVVVEEFADFQCPICKIFNERVQPRIIEDYVKTGKIRYQFNHFIVIDGNVGGSESRHAAEASECAADQGRFWDYHEMVYANQGREGSGALSDERLKAFAEAIGMDRAAFNTCFTAHRFASTVTGDEARAAALGLRGTPSVVINGKAVDLNNPTDYDAIKTAIDAALAAAQ